MSLLPLLFFLFLHPLLLPTFGRDRSNFSVFLRVPNFDGFVPTCRGQQIRVQRMPRQLVDAVRVTFEAKLPTEPAGLLVESEASDCFVVGSRSEPPPVATPADRMDFGGVGRIFLRLRRTLEEMG